VTPDAWDEDDVHASYPRTYVRVMSPSVHLLVHSIATRKALVGSDERDVSLYKALKVPDTCCIGKDTYEKDIVSIVDCVKKFVRYLLYSTAKENSAGHKSHRLCTPLYV